MVKRPRFLWNEESIFLPSNYFLLNGFVVKFRIATAVSPQSNYLVAFSLKILRNLNFVVLVAKGPRIIIAHPLSKFKIFFSKESVTIKQDRKIKVKSNL